MPPCLPLDGRATVVIIGCGPAGASCAIKLKKIASSLIRALLLCNPPELI